MRINKLFFSFIFCVLTSALFAVPALRVSKAVSLIDEELSIEVRGVQPFERVVLKAETTDAKGEKWSSEAIFCADEKGRVRLSRNAPLEGSYSGVDGMGLFWSLHPESKEHAVFRVPDSMLVNILLIIDKHPVAAKQIERLKKRRDVKRTEVREKGLVGALYTLPSKHPLPVIVTLEGWNGGMEETKSQLLASHGFAVLALAYFGEEGLPSRLENIPLEYFKTAFQWLQSRPELDDHNIGLFGVSRGAELALLLGTLFPESVHAIAAVAPTSTAFGSFENPIAPAWTYQGQAISAVKSLPTLLGPIEKEGIHPTTPLKTAPRLLRAMEKQEVFSPGIIPVEKIRCPLLLLSGGDDQMWPATVFATQIKQRLENKGSKTYVRHYDYPKAGHHIYLPFIPTHRLFYHPLTKKWLSLGGTAQEDNQASFDGWRKTLAFFQNKLKNRTYENP